MNKFLIGNNINSNIKEIDKMDINQVIDFVISVSNGVQEITGTAVNCDEEAQSACIQFFGNDLEPVVLTINKI